MTTSNELQLTPEEQAVVAAFAQRVRQDPNLSSVSDERLIQFMMARKFEEDRAYELLLNSIKWRSEHGIGEYLPMNQAIASELKTQKIIIPPMSRDREGSQVVYYRPGLTKKHTTKQEDFCLSVFFMLHHCIRDPLTQRKGFLFICDLRNTKLLQVDRKLVKSILDMLSNKFPARLKKVLLLEPPSFFNVAFRIVRPLIPSKYMDKLATARMPDLQAYVDADKLLPDYGGTLPFDPVSYVDQLGMEEQKIMQAQQTQQYQQAQQQFQQMPQQQVHNTITPQYKLDANTINPVAPEGIASQ